MGMELDYRIVLKQKRKKMKWTQQEAADRIGISRSYFSDIESGKTIPSGKTLFSINEVIPIFLPFNVADGCQYKEVEQNV